MASEGNDIQKLTDRIDTLVQVNERLIRVLSQSLPATGEAAHATAPIKSVPTTASGSNSPSLPPTIPLAGRTRRNTPVSVLDIDSVRKPSLYTGEEDSAESDDDESFFVQDTLPPESFAEEELNHHIRSYQFEPHAQAILEEVLKDPQSLDKASLIPTEAEVSPEHAAYHHVNVYEVGTDGSALAYNAGTKDPSRAIWKSLSNTNADRTRQRKAVGKIIILREPSALLFGAVHLTMNKHFDMDQLFRLLTDRTVTKAYMKGCLKSDQRQQRSFIYSFKYHCIIEDPCEPKAWQMSDGDLTSSRDHIPISTCSSIVALSLSGKPTNTLKRRCRKANIIVGQIFDPFAPWRVLSIQCFPDRETTVDVHEQNRHYVNGVEAFLVTVLAEYKDAQKRLRQINERIVQLVTPPPTFMFDGGLRDILLFEDRRYTYSRRYFWAFQTLATMNDSIEALIDTYKETFTDEVWTGEHNYIWPGTKDQSSRYSNWRKKMASLRKQFEATIKELKDVLALNIKEQKDIKSLRDQLFSGTSVKESREAIRQNDNIKLLTLVTIFFLPLTFASLPPNAPYKLVTNPVLQVTSIFGMTNMPPTSNFTHFGITTIAICIPSYLLIFSLNSDTWQERYRAMFDWIREFLAHPFSRHRSELQRPRNWWSRFWEPKSASALQKRRQSHWMSYEDSVSRTGKLGVAFGQQESRRPSFPQLSRAGSRNSAVKFDMPSFGRRPRLENLEMNLSDLGPLATLPEEDLSNMSGPKRSLFKSFADKISVQKSPKSPV